MKIGDTIYFYSKKYPESGIHTFTIDNLLYQRRENEDEELVAIESYYNMEQWAESDSWMKTYYLCKSGGYESPEPLYYESCTFGTFYWSPDKKCIEENYKISLDYRIKDLERWLEEAKGQINEREDN